MLAKTKIFLLASFVLSLAIGSFFLFLALPSVQAADVDVTATVPSSATCGNNIKEGSEECDGTDNSSCATGSCYPSGHTLQCTCIPAIGCFLQGTDIYLPDETSSPIEQIKTGDSVLSYDIQTGELEPALVLQIFKHEADKYLLINNKIKVTSNHPFYINGRWQEIGNAKIGDKMLSQTGEGVLIFSIKTETGDFFVYNLEVSKNHNYFADGYLVHNKGECIPNCAGKQCGSDNCGGSCGTCGAGESCVAGQCVPPSPYCGDGIINQASEECEPPLSSGCSFDCKIVFAIISHGVPEGTITNNSAVINWVTNLSSTSVLEWRQSGGVWDNSREGLSGTSYSQTISGLLPGIVYDYRIVASKSSDPLDQKQVSGSFQTSGGLAEICENGIDDDLDGLIDYLDPDCYCEAIYSCSPWQPDECPQEGIQTRTCQWINSDVCWNPEPSLPTSRTCTPGECSLSCGVCQFLNIDSCICENISPCCGNGSCEPWAVPPEDYNSCPADCHLDCIPDWQCSDWGPCIDGIQIRQCYDQHACGNNLGRPDETMSCFPGCEISCGVCQQINLNQCVCEELSPCCGNLVCEAGETNESCPQDCVSVCIPNWVPSDWSECINGVQTRSYYDLNNCPYALHPPPGEMSCIEGCEISCGVCQKIDVYQCVCQLISPCCGNGICEIDRGENVVVCPVDCGLPPDLEVTLPQCLDGIDNDNDGLIDYPSDPGCSNPYDESELSIIEVLEKITELLDNPQVEEVNKIVTPILIATAVANAFATFSFFNFLSYLQYFITQPFAALFKRRRRRWGVVYNSLSKQPVDLAIVRLYQKENGRLVQSRVTDKVGRYNFLVDPGRYYLTVTKPKFEFPTKYLKDEKQDVKYLDLYHGQVVEIKENQSSIIYNIPIDPLEKTQKVLKIIFLHYLRKFQYTAAFLAVPLAAISTIISPGPLTFSLLALHCLLFVFFYRLGYQKAPKSWGKIFDKSNGKAISAAIVRIYDKKYNKLLETRVTDARGRYSFLVNNNVYYLTAEKTGYQLYKSSDIDLVSKDKEAVVGLNIGLEKGTLLHPIVQPQVPESKAQEASSVDKEAKPVDAENILDKKDPKIKPLDEKAGSVEVGRDSLEYLLKVKEKMPDIEKGINQKNDVPESSVGAIENVKNDFDTKIANIDNESNLKADLPLPSSVSSEQGKEKPEELLNQSASGEIKKDDKPGQPSPEKSIFG